MSVPVHRSAATAEGPAGLATTGDAELLAGLVVGRPAAVAELFNRYAVLVGRLLERILGSDDIDDPRQETFLTVLRRAADLRDPSVLRSFIVATAIRVAKNELRKRRIRQWIGLDEDINVPLLRPHDAVVAEQVRAVYRVLDRMDASSRLLFVLRRVEELELGELAEATGCSLATLKRRLVRAERRFTAIASGEPALRDWLRGGEP